MALSVLSWNKKLARGGGAQGGAGKGAVHERVGVGSIPNEDGRRSCGPRACRLLACVRAWDWALRVEEEPMLATVKWRNCLWLSFKSLLFKLFLDQNLSGWSLGSGVGVLGSTLQPPTQSPRRLDQKSAHTCSNTAAQGQCLNEAPLLDFGKNWVTQADHPERNFVLL